MFKEIENSNLVFDTELNKLAYKRISGKLNYRDNFVRDGILCCTLEQMAKNGRLVKRTYPLLTIICKYVYNIDLTDKIVSLRNDNNDYSLSNIEIKDINDLCDEWVTPEELRGEYKLSRNGDVYSISRRMLRMPPLNGNYFLIYGNRIHGLVFKYFNGAEIKSGYTIDHIDNNPINNKLENLQLISINENIKKERERVVGGSRYIIHNGKYYFLNSNYNGTEYNKKEETKIYENAISLLKDGKLEECFHDHDYIYFNFLTLKWRVHHFPRTYTKTAPSEFRGKEFNSFAEAEKYFNDVCTQFNLKYIRKGVEGDYEYFKTKGEISFKHLGKNYSFSVLNSKTKKTNDYVLKFYCSHTKEEFIEKLEDFKEMRKKEIEENKIRLKNEQEKNRILKLEENRKNRETKEKIKLEKWEELEKLPCYEPRGNCFVMYCYNRGVKYFIGKLFSQKTAEELDSIIKKRDKNIDFKRWLEEIKEKYSELRKKDIESEMMRVREEESKGYWWFEPRKCWRSAICHNGKSFPLGYFKNETCCQVIYKEALNAISFGLFDKWYVDIKLHRDRIKKMCS